jgi:hypothetical protein
VTEERGEVALLERDCPRTLPLPGGAVEMEPDRLLGLAVLWEGYKNLSAEKESVSTNERQDESQPFVNEMRKE